MTLVTEAREVTAQRTPGEWRLDDGRRLRGAIMVTIDGMARQVAMVDGSAAQFDPAQRPTPEVIEANARTIVTAVNLLPLLADEVERLEKERDAAQRFASAPDHVHPSHLPTIIDVLTTDRDRLAAEVERLTVMARHEVDAEESASASGHERQRYLCGIGDGAGGGYAPCPTRDALRAEVERLTRERDEARERQRLTEEQNDALGDVNVALVQRDSAIAEVGTLRARVAELEGHLATLHEAVPVVREVASDSTAEQIAAWLERGWVSAYEPGENIAADAITEAVNEIRNNAWRQERDVAVETKEERAQRKSESVPPRGRTTGLSTLPCSRCKVHHKLAEFSYPDRVIADGKPGSVVSWSQYGSPVYVLVEHDELDEHGFLVRENYSPCQLQHERKEPSK